MLFKNIIEFPQKHNSPQTMLPFVDGVTFHHVMAYDFSNTATRATRD